MTESTSPLFRERLVPGIGTAVALLLIIPGVALVLLPLGVPGWLPLPAGVLAALLVGVSLWAGQPVVAVRDGVLEAGAARIPVAMTGSTEVFRREEARTARGTGLDARAWTLLRGWVDPVLRIEVVDPDDPAPYWVVSTRRPEALASAIAAARTGG